MDFCEFKSDDNKEYIMFDKGNYFLCNTGSGMIVIDLGNTLEDAKNRLIELWKDKKFPEFMND